MKKGIHPEYKKAVITCGCGEKIVTRSTKGDAAVGICSKCHPFFTGKQKFVDTAGRVEKFQRRYGWSGRETRGAKEKEHRRAGRGAGRASGRIGTRRKTHRSESGRTL